jgi:cytochrome c oxidase subunit II
MSWDVQSALDPAGPQAASIGHLFWLFVGVCGAVYVAVLLVLVMVLVRRRRSRDDRIVPRPPAATEARMGRVIGGATALTVVLLFVLLTASYAADRAILGRHGQEALTIEVVGHQWWWEVRYDGEPARRFITANEIHVPVGQKVRLRLTSPDVIHSFWVPNLHGKRDLIPGIENTFYLEADRPGRWRGQCAEFCGLQHAFMALWFVAEPPEAFAAWREAQLRAAPEPAAETARRGREVFLSRACVMCHAIRGTTAAAIMGPDLTHLKSRATIAAGILPNTRGHLAAWVADPQSVKPGTRMPITALEPGELQALLDYLETLE